jgi:hypothetical protein
LAFKRQHEDSIRTGIAAHPRLAITSEKKNQKFFSSVFAAFSAFFPCFHSFFGDHLPLFDIAVTKPGTSVPLSNNIISLLIFRA